MGIFSKTHGNDTIVEEHDDQGNTVTKKARYQLGKKGMIFACGAALFSDGYANASIGPVNTILKILYPAELANSNYSSLISSLAFAGTIVGMLGFGYTSDKYGRKGGMLICTGIVFIFSALEAAAKGKGVDGMLKALCAYRFLVGIGIGGEYPTGSTAASESSEDPSIGKKSQQRLFVLATNSMIDLGFVLANFVALVLLWIFGTNHLGAVWRITLGLGVVPPMILLFFRVFMKEPESYVKHSMAKMPIPHWLVFKRYWLRLAAVSITWFIYDWITYPFGLYSSTITAVADQNGTLYTAFGWSTLVNFFYLPGTIIGAFVVDRLGPKYTMITGLLCQAAIGFILSGCYNLLVPNHIAGFAILYGIFLSFGELGPGNCLGLLASKAIGPTAVRGQYYGIAAAIVGAFIGTYTFPQIIDSLGGSDTYGGKTGVFWIGSGLAVLSAAITFFFIENIKPDHMLREDLAFRAYLVENGIDVSAMGLQDTVADLEKREDSREAITINGDASKEKTNAL